MNLQTQHRNSYIDFLRALGLLLIVMAHTWPPQWMALSRPFVVPMLVMISAACYRNPENSYSKYLIKRFRRIYSPTAVFLSIFFLLLYAGSLCGVTPPADYKKIIGSFLLLDKPSIGYVWIMRVMLLMAIIMPGLHKLTARISNHILVVLIILCVGVQDFLVAGADYISSPFIKDFYNQFFLYTTGYLPFAMLGLKLHTIRRADLIDLVIMTGVVIFTLVYMHGVEFNPDLYKYPPQLLYLVYGMLICPLLWLLRPVLQNITKGKFITFLSENSLQIYLWHILPVYLLIPISHLPGLWFARFSIALAGGILLALLYNRISKKLQIKI